MKGKPFQRLLKTNSRKIADEYPRKINHSQNRKVPLTNVKKQLNMYIDLCEEEFIEEESTKIICNTSDIFNESSYLDKSENNADSSYEEAFKNAIDLPNILNQRAIKELNESNQILEEPKEIDYFLHSKEPNVFSSTIKLNSWIPIFVDGICRFIGQIKKRNRKKLQIITEPVFDYIENERLVITNGVCYQLFGNFDRRYLSSNTPEPVLTKADWLKDVTLITGTYIFENKDIVNTSLKGWSHNEIMRFKIRQLRRTNKSRILKNKIDSKAVFDNTEIRSELTHVLDLCQDNGNWRDKFEEFLNKYNQKLILQECLVEEECILTRSFSRNVDIDDEENYNKFVCHEDMFNSTINNLTEKLYLWSVIINEDKRFCITGLKMAGKRYVEVVPTLIESVTNDGTYVLAVNGNFILVGPLYKLSMYCCYPNSENTDYMDLFQQYFKYCLPKHWKNVISVAHVICGLCTNLRKGAEESESFSEDVFAFSHMINNVPNMNLTKQDKKAPSEKQSNEVIDEMAYDEITLSSIASPSTSVNVSKARGWKPATDIILFTSMTSQKGRKSSKQSTNIKERETSFSADIQSTTHRHTLHIVSNITDLTNIVFTPIIGLPVDLTRIPVTRSGRVSLPPPDPLSDTAFVRVGCQVKLVSKGITTMVFDKSPT